MRILLTAIAIIPLFSIGSFTYSQESDSVQNSTLGVHFFVNDHFSGKLFKTNPSPSVAKSFSGLALSFTKGISKRVDWNVVIYGTFADSIIKGKPPTGKKDFFIDANFSIRAKMFSSPKRVQPFVQGGIGVSQYKNYTGVFVPVGGGVQVNVFRDAYITLQTKYSLPIGSGFRDYFSYSLGTAGVIGRKKRKPPVESIASPITAVQNQLDRDHDGILDKVDICPTVPGLKEFTGCPDSDRDGVPDPLDECRYVPGMIEYKGCPAPDTDNDGILDIADKCVDAPGLKEYQGCPETDKDQDGVGDKYDECPDVKGIRENAGCPEITQEIKRSVSAAAQNIFFSTGSYILLAKSFKSLDEVVTILKNNPKMKLRIEGHTDDVNDSVQNQKLSEERANSVMKYIIGKGIQRERLTAKGFGESIPAFENRNAESRATNRRVELKLHY